jgi:hypothetical protein
VDITAPGESVWHAETDAVGGPYSHKRGNGTSYAVATTAAVCALWMGFWGRQNLIDQYTKPRLASVFKELAMKTARDPGGWETDKYGAGILDAEALLKEDLPDTPVAARMAIRASAAPRPLNVLDDVAEHFPDLSRAKVRSGVTKLLDTTEAELPKVLAKFGDELLFHVVTDPAVRARIRSPLPKAAKKADVVVAGARAGSRMQRTASAQFKQQSSL